MKFLKNILSKLQNIWIRLHISTKFIFIICIVSFLSISISIFTEPSDTNTNLVVIRSVFSAIMGYLLDDSTKRLIDCSDKFLLLKNLCIGSLSLIILFLLLLSSIIIPDVNSSSLVLLRSTLFSCVGFLISASKDCK